MSKRKAVRVQHLCDIPLDLDGVWLRLERRWWPDGSSCLHIAKWGIQRETGRPTPWWPPQYTQVSWDVAQELGAIIREVTARSHDDGDRPAVAGCQAQHGADANDLPGDRRPAGVQRAQPR